MALRAESPRDPAAFWRDIATPAVRICYEELQVVAGEFCRSFVMCRRWDSNPHEVALTGF
jgi:hypothetical protein